MADKEMGFVVYVDAEAVKGAGKKAVQEIAKEVDSNTKGVKVPVDLSVNISDSNQKVKNAQAKVIENFKKMTAEGFSASHSDIEKLKKDVTNLGDAMDKAHIGRQNGIYRLIQKQANELSKTYEAIQKETKKLEAKSDKVKTTTKKPRKSSKKYIGTGHTPSEEELQSNISDDKRRKFKGIKTISPKGYRRDVSFDTGGATSGTVLETDRSGPYRSNFARQMRISELAAMKWMKRSLKIYKNQDQANQLATAAINGKSGIPMTDKAKATEKAYTASKVLAKILGGLEHANPEASLEQFDKYLEGVFKYNKEAGKNDWEAILLSLDKTFDRYFNSNGALGVTDGTPKGEAEGHKNAQLAITGMIKKFKEVLEDSNLDKLEVISDNYRKASAEQIRQWKAAAEIDPIGVAKEMDAFLKGTSVSNTKKGSITKTNSQMERELSKTTKAIEDQTTIDKIENAAERVSDDNEFAQLRKNTDEIIADASTGLNSAQDTAKLFGHQLSTNRLLGEIKDLLTSIFSDFSKGNHGGGNGGGNPPNSFGPDGGNEPANILTQILQTLTNIDVNVGNILQNLITQTGKIPNNLPALVEGETAKDHPSIPEPFTDNTDYKKLYSKRLDEEQRTEIEQHAKMKMEELKQNEEAQKKLNKRATEAFSGGIELSKVISSPPATFLDKLKKAFSPMSAADRAMTMTPEEQMRARARRVETFGENNGRNLTDTGDIASVKRTKTLFGWVYKNDEKNKQLFQDIKLTPGFTKDTTIDTTKILQEVSEALKDGMFEAQTGGGFKNLLGSIFLYAGMPSLEKSRAEAEGMNEAMAKVRGEILQLVQQIQTKEMTLKGMQDIGTAKFTKEGMITSDSSPMAQKTFIDLEEQKGVLRSALAEANAFDQIVKNCGGNIHKALQEVSFFMPELLQYNTIFQNLNAGLDKNGKVLKFQSRTAEILNYSFQLMSRSIGQMYKNWMAQLNPITQIKKLFSDFTSYNVKWQRTMNVIKYNMRAIFRPFMEWIAQQIVNIIGLFDTVSMVIQRAFGKVPISLFDQAAADTEKMNEELEAAANTSAGFDELHDIGSDNSGANDLLGDIYTPQWTGLSEIIESIGDRIAKIIETVSHWNFWDWLKLIGGALVGFMALKWLLGLFTGGSNPLQSVAKGFSFLEKAVGWALLIWAFTEFTKALTDFVECMKTAEWEDITKSLIMLGGAFAELFLTVGGLLYLSNTLGILAPSVVAIGVVVGALALFVVALTDFIECMKSASWEDIVKSLLMLAGAFATVVLVIGGLLSVLTVVISTRCRSCGGSSISWDFSGDCISNRSYGSICGRSW